MTNWAVGDCSSREGVKAVTTWVLVLSLLGILPSAHGGRDWHVGKEAAMAANPCMQLNNGASFPRQLVLHPGAFLTPIPSGYLCAANSNPFPVPALLTPCFNTQPLPDWQTPMSGYGMQRCGIDHLCKPLSVLPVTNQPLHFLPIAPKSPDDVSSWV